MKKSSLRSAGVSFPNGLWLGGDVMLAQKIALETDEAAVLALAHRFSPRLPSLPRVARRAY
ncbi:hypothetical protein ABIB90_007113 [Bradyrhizobium sp. JR4.1]|uniref:hypothetical protein n=1 Tax=unclassified Bradyrhizobium TaxID=2631580 RepID=UPI0026B60CBC